MSNIVNKVKINPDFFKGRVNYVNPLWFANHLSKDDRMCLIDNIDVILEETKKYEIKYSVADNLSSDGTYSAFTQVRNLVRTIEEKTNSDLYKFTAPAVEYTRQFSVHVPIASDFIHMVESFYGDSYTKTDLLSIRSLAIYEFNNIHDVIGIIDAAGSIADKRSELTLFEIFNGIDQTLKMLSYYLTFMDMERSKINEMIMSDISDTLEMLGDIEAYLSMNIHDVTDHAHVVTFINEIIRLYLLCSVDKIDDMDHMKHMIRHGYLYRRIERMHHNEREELEKILDESLMIAFSPAGTPNTIERLNAEKKMENEITISKNERCVEPKHTCPGYKDPMENLSFKEREEIAELSDIKPEDILSSIYDKIGVREDSVIIKPFSDISEELLAMYLAEFNDTHPIQMFPNIERFFIVWEDNWHLLFQLSSPNGEFKTFSNCLYAIRVKENSTSGQKEYSLIQFKKSNSVKYLFEY